MVNIFQNAYPRQPQITQVLETLENVLVWTCSLLKEKGSTAHSHTFLEVPEVVQEQ